jgi:DNA (cytosine-5)-methyltransferase 1
MKLTKEIDPFVEAILQKAITEAEIDAFVERLIQKYPDIHNFYIDLFCGAGGTTEGVEKARYKGKKVAKVVWCINHDKLAIASHFANHPDCIHRIEDIRRFKLKPLLYLVKQLRERVPNCIIHLWASLECTNFSKAKGGLPRDADSRTLAEDLLRYIKAIKPEYIWIENVREFMSWGPLDEKGKPVSKNNGRDYLRWIHSVQSHGYDFDWKLINAADLGAYTSRIRYFAQFAKGSLPIKWPSATHSKNPEKTMFSDLSKWKAVKEVLDFSDEGESIFIPGRIKSPKTFERIYEGCIKHIAGGKEAFINQRNGGTKNRICDIDAPARTITGTGGNLNLVQPGFIKKWNSNNSKTGTNSGSGLNSPCPVVTTQNRLGLVQPSYLIKYYSGNPENKNSSLCEPCGTLRTKDSHGLVSISFLSKVFSGKPQHKNISVEGPCNTITTFGGPVLVNACFFQNYYSNGGGTTSINEPSGSITTKDRFALVKPCFYWLDKQFSGKDNHQSVEQPTGSILSNDKHSLIKAESFLDRQFSSGTKSSGIDRPAGSLLTVPKISLVQCRWLMNHTFKDLGTSVDNPAPTLLASRRHYYLMNPQFNDKGTSLEKPCFTLIARMDKKPPYLISTENGELAIEVYETDLPIVKKLKEFMALYGIIDIKMRMLKVPELLRIQGFPPGYILRGSQKDQKKFIGNSVPPEMAEHTTLANYLGVIEHFNIAA